MIFIKMSILIPFVCFVDFCFSICWLWLPPVAETRIKRLLTIDIRFWGGEGYFFSFGLGDALMMEKKKKFCKKVETDYWICFHGTDWMEEKVVSDHWRKEEEGNRRMDRKIWMRYTKYFLAGICGIFWLQASQWLQRLSASLSPQFSIGLYRAAAYARLPIWNTRAGRRYLWPSLAFGRLVL